MLHTLSLFRAHHRDRLADKRDERMHEIEEAMQALVGLPVLVRGTAHHHAGRFCLHRESRC